MLRNLHPKHFYAFTPDFRNRIFNNNDDNKWQIITELNSLQSIPRTHACELSTDHFKCQLDCVSYFNIVSFASRKLPSAPAATRTFLRETWRGHGDSSGSYLRIRDLTEYRGQALKQQHCLPAPQEMGWTRRLIPSHCVLLFVLSSFLLCLSFLSHIQATAVLSDQRSVGRWCLPLCDILSATEGVRPALLCPNTGLAATAAGSPKPASQPQRERPGC